MYEFHYIKVKYGSNANFLFTGTENLVYEIKADGVRKDFYENKNLLDFSDYSKDSQLFYPVNQKLIGKMKDEAGGKIIDELAG